MSIKDNTGSKRYQVEVFLEKKRICILSVSSDQDLIARLPAIMRSSIQPRVRRKLAANPLVRRKNGIITQVVLRLAGVGNDNSTLEDVPPSPICPAARTST